MYKLTEAQRNTLLYILEHLTVTGPDQGGLLSNAGAIVRGVEQVEEPMVEEEKNNDDQ